MIRVGSLCTGYDGLGLGLESAGVDVERAWFAEIDPAMSRVLAHHWPDTKNLDDITAVDWSTVERVDLLTAGFPCQDVSAAGLRRGLAPGTRTGLWYSVATAIDALRPPLVILENVHGLLSARAHSDLEPCTWCVGDDPDRPVLRALGAILGDLADLGFDAEWVSVSAGSVGAPHLRWRVFIAAWPSGRPDVAAAVVGRAALAGAPGHPWPIGYRDGDRAADTASVGHGNVGSASIVGVPAAPVAGGDGSDGLTFLPTPRARDGKGRDPNPRGVDLNEAVALLPTPRTNDMRGVGDHGDGGLDLRTAVSLLPTPMAADSDRSSVVHPRGNPTLVGALLPTPAARLGGRGVPNQETAERRLYVEGRRNLEDSVALLPTPRATDGAKGGPNQRGSSGDLMLPSAVVQLLPTPTSRLGRTGGNPERGSRSDRTTTGPDLADAISVERGDRWGQYARAIARWEAALGRPAPDPTEPGSKGQPRLSPRFVEWLMGLPAGHVTDHCTRTEALRGLGNGVVPQQCATAVTQLIAVVARECRAGAA